MSEWGGGGLAQQVRLPVACGITLVSSRERDCEKQYASISPSPSVLSLRQFIFTFCLCFFLLFSFYSIHPTRPIEPPFFLHSSLPLDLLPHFNPLTQLPSSPQRITSLLLLFLPRPPLFDLFYQLFLVPSPINSICDTSSTFFFLLVSPLFLTLSHSLALSLSL